MGERERCKATVRIYDDRVGVMVDRCELPEGHPAFHLAERSACDPSAALIWKGSADQDASASSTDRETDSDVEPLRRALRLTREYVGERALPAAPGWEWYEAVKATGGFDGFGRCGCVLDPQVHGRPRAGDLFYCTLAAGHEGDHTLSAPPTDRGADR